jgi:hypothetical protein
MKISRSCTLLVISFALILMPSCKTVEYLKQDPFYRNGSEWDHLRFPLIKPYFAIYIDDEYGWGIPLEGSPSNRDFYYYLQIHDVQKIAVEKGVIMVYTPYKELVDARVGQKILYWFVFIPDQNIEQGFEKEQDFLVYIQQIGIQQPAWRTPDDILEEYDETRCLDWIPSCN